MRISSSSAIRKWSFYLMICCSFLILFSFQNCGKVKFSAPKSKDIISQSCGDIQMIPVSGLYPDTSVSFEVVTLGSLTVSALNWDFTKDTTSVFTSLINPVVYTFNHANEGAGDYVANATFTLSDGNNCNLQKSFKIINNDVCADPSGISGPNTGFVGEETSPFSIGFESCFNGSVTWDMNNDGVVEYSVPDAQHPLITDPVTHTYGAPGTYTVKAVITNNDDQSQITLTHQIVIQYKSCINPFTNAVVQNGQSVQFAKPNALCGSQPCLTTNRTCNNGAFGGDTTYTQNPATCAVSAVCPPQTCTNGATNPPTCTTCPTGKVLVGGQCINTCTNGATNPPTCTTCPTGKVLVGGQCINTCTNGATNPPTCTTCPTGKILVGGQCVTPANCVQDGVTVLNGQSRNFFLSSSVGCGLTCQSQSRTCNNGVLSGTYPNATCAVASCSFAWSVGNFGACSATACGTSGTQTRTVVCKRSDGVVVADLNCTTPKPAVSQACSAAACTCGTQNTSGPCEVLYYCGGVYKKTVNPQTVASIIDPAGTLYNPGQIINGFTSPGYTTLISNYSYICNAQGSWVTNPGTSGYCKLRKDDDSSVCGTVASGCSPGKTWQFSYNDSYGQSDDVCRLPLCSSIAGTSGAVANQSGPEVYCVGSSPGTCCSSSAICNGGYKVYTCQ